MSLPFNRLYLQRSARQHSKLQQLSIISSITYDIHPLVSILVSHTVPPKSLYPLHHFFPSWLGGQREAVSAVSHVAHVRPSSLLFFSWVGNFCVARRPLAGVRLQPYISAGAVRAAPCSSAQMSSALLMCPLIFSLCILYFQFESCLLYLSLRRGGFVIVWL